MGVASGSWLTIERSSGSESVGELRESHRVPGVGGGGGGARVGQCGMAETTDGLCGGTVAAR